ncbi:hypothetical protein VTO42DRAFT_2127 [Malbranchea cinnamomea]
MMSGIVEVELPRCTITPLDRHSDPEYWKLNPTRSSIKGGSWTFFHWNRLVTGKKLYRIQYKDELRVPQAEIEFDELLAFLIDRGAVPDENGWNMLRTSGLWTPTGTVLLRAPGGASGVALCVGVPDDSDGVLSLKVNWQSEWDKRGPDSLPPFWTRIHEPKKMPCSGNPAKTAHDLVDVDGCEVETTGSIDNNGKTPQVVEPSSSLDTTEVKEGAEEEDPEGNLEPETSILSLIEKKKKALPGSAGKSNSVRFQLEGDTVNRVYFERDGILTGDTQDMTRIGDIAKQWFSSAVSALSRDEESGRWHFDFPSHIVQCVHRDSIPCGVMVLFDILGEDDVPQWGSPPPTTSDPLRLHRRYMEDIKQHEVEKTMPPAQAEAARRARVSAKIHVCNRII